VEVDSESVATLTANSRYFPSAKIIERPIEFITSDELLEVGGLKKHEAALLIGGPPCQPFSKAGYWLQNQRNGHEDGRASYLEHYLRVLRDTRPTGFIFENVPSLLHPAQLGGLEYLVWRARRLGYSVKYRVLHAPEYGVPQSRSRLFVIGLRGRAMPEFPTTTHWWHAPETSRKLLPPETAGRWIARLDSTSERETEENVTGRWEEALRQIPPGKNYKHLTAWAGHAKPLFVTETKYWSFLLKLSPYRPSWTLQASPGPWVGPFHWEGRRLRTAEMAALQTFPTEYRISGGRRARIRQVGNAVPSVLAACVARQLLHQVTGKLPRRGRALQFSLSDDFPFDAESLRHRGHRW
jgi:DNA (cytosine-5)-methyltransferase 1